ncbi:hypothetical protein DJ568_08440 [Mucilaginibacter hurinus]|uniref:Uncharacterized protein n=1 Tax=Mucilaginibacter hurinus TaxID=2201324 RepID=A0A367GQ44_9SPHI|nr:hypothetical protein [Mucilaginibacter hurinus]RCH55205.1 hypothetical protein DJ568_08440 [Mucilaginibacter hurinus]
MDKKNDEIKDEIALKEIEAGLSSYSVKNRLWIVALLSVIIVVAVWVTKSNEVIHVKEEAEKSSIRFKGQAKKEVVHSHEEHIKLLTKPLVWALAAQIEQRNLKQVERYLDEMVKEENFMLLAVIDEKGKIIVATNKSYQGKDFGRIADKNLLNSNEVKLVNKNDKVLLATRPIKGRHTRLGTLVIQYKLAPNN